MNHSFEGKRALVTGGGRGIGRSIAIALQEKGANTFIVDKTQEDLILMKEEFPEINTLCVDLTKWDEVTKAIKDLGHIDLLVNNAGIVIADRPLEYNEPDMDKLFAINVKALVNVTQVVGQGMIEQGKGGAIVNISSNGSKEFIPNVFVYSLTKAAVDNATEMFAVDLGKHHIRVNAVNPTIVKTTDISRPFFELDQTEVVKSKIPLDEFPEIQDVVDVVLYLLSDKAKFINGECILIDGGMHCS